MFFKALAFDFDGTLASDDRIGPGVREGLERARQAGLRLILVTGRTFFELSRSSSYGRGARASGSAWWTPPERDDIREPNRGAPLTSARYTVGPRSVVVLVRPRSL
jgi:hypothetical protein